MIPAAEAGWVPDWVSDACNTVVNTASNMTCPSISVCDPVFQALFNTDTAQFITITEQSMFFFFVILTFGISMMCGTGTTLPGVINLSAALIGPITTMKYVGYSLRYGIPYAFHNPISFVLIVIFISFIPSIIFKVANYICCNMRRKAKSTKKKIDDIQHEMASVKQSLDRISTRLKNIQ